MKRSANVCKMKHSNFLCIYYVYLPVYNISFESWIGFFQKVSWIGFFQKVKRNVLENFQNILFDEHHLCSEICYKPCFFINIGSKVIPQSRANVNNTGTTRMTHRKLYWMTWVHVLFNLGIITLTTTIDTSYWNFKKVVLYTVQSFRHSKVH